MAISVRNNPTFEDFRVTGFIKPGNYGSIRIEVQKVEGIWALRAAMKGERLYEGDTMTNLFHNGLMWMSDTRDEYRDHVEAIRNAKGRVLVHGLGLGCFLKAILVKPEVTHVDVVEISSDICKVMGPYYTEDKRVNLICENAFLQAKKWPKGSRWDVIWHDIWLEKTPDNLLGISHLKRMFGHKCDWQGAWAEEQLRLLKRRDKRRY